MNPIINHSYGTSENHFEDHGNASTRSAIDIVQRSYNNSYDRLLSQHRPLAN